MSTLTLRDLGFVGGLGGGAATDPYFSSVSLLLHGDGANNSTTFTDNSPRTKTVSIRAGSPVISTANSKFGGASIYGGTTGGGVQVINSTDFTYGTGDMAIEFWVNFTQAGENYIIDHATGNAGAIVRRGGTSRLLYYDATAGFGNLYNTGWGILNNNQWYFVQFLRESGVCKCVLDGTTISTQTVSHNFTSQNIMINGSPPSPGGAGANAYIDDLRVTKGVSRAATVPTAAFPDS